MNTHKRLPRLTGVIALVAGLVAFTPTLPAMADAPTATASASTTAVRAPISPELLAQPLANGKTQATQSKLDKMGGDPRVTAYWTPERMKNAIPLDTPEADATVQRELKKLETPEPSSPLTTLSEPVAAQRKTATPQDAPPVTNFSVTNGKVFFHNQTNGLDYICSGSSVNSGSKRLVITAGHCVYGAPGNAWHTNWQFVPGYNSGSRPRGTFQAYTMRTYNDWIDYGESGRGFNSDVAFVTTYTNASGQRVVDAVGGHGTQYGGSRVFDVDIFGYPGNLNGGEVMWACWGTTGTRWIGLYEFSSIDGCNFGGGSSGGPWLASYSNSTGLGYVHTITSNGPTDSTAYINGPYFDSRFPDLYAAANNDW